MLVLWLIFSFQIVFSQEFEMVRHQVKMGETVRMLSKKYKVEPAEIYRLNKFAVDGIKEGMVLQILVERAEPVASDEAVPESAPSESEQLTESTPVESNPVADIALAESPRQEITHKVGKGETLYSLSRKYNVPVDEIKAQNEEALKKGLQTGQVLIIRANN
jgi:LysM repeat protein